MRSDAVVTTANAGWMPAFPVADPGNIHTRRDGRWGPQEFTLWPQLYDPRVIHHACIPTGGGRLAREYNVPVSLYDPVDESKWSLVDDCGVPDLGCLEPDYLDTLRGAILAVVHQFADHSKSGSEKMAWGRHLSLTIRQGLDRLAILPSWRSHTIALAAHLQRLALELYGMIILVDVVQARIEDPAFRAASMLSVRGVFTSKAAEAQNFFRIGLPYWFIQPLTTTVRVRNLTIPVPVSSKLEEAKMRPALFSGPGDMAGVVQNPGLWPFKMQEVAENTLLPRTVPTTSDRGQSSKKGSTSRRKARNRRALRPDDPPPTSVSSSSNVPSPLPHASIRFQLPKLCEVPEAWADALARVGTLPTPRVASVYYWPPPFWFEIGGEKVKRFSHNYVRIRAFCRQRLLDSTLGAQPLRIAEWRDALWGDYAVAPEDGERIAPATHRRDQQQRVRALFANTAGLRTYEELQKVRWGDRVLDLDSVNTPEVRAQILWEVHEVNWRCEFRELDAVMTGSRMWNQDLRWEREAHVCRVWSTTASGLRVVPDWEHGRIAAGEWHSPPHPQWINAALLLEHFVDVMRRWPGLPEQLKTMPASVIGDEDVFMGCQKLAVRFYVRCFVDTFHRLPIPPAVLPPNFP
ncbi:hypothetical protein FOMPIDRAFT_1123547 [Fomitopsis schrenkii]|uniref:Uncharacterized protein n=1 Tax=Fomitopsis schrenkii TaxID=2126942 RepID=S8FEJ0_FOMSC|nr:hypothetical protein FOMPIDRAFT_1123547 [Fomitopsis schrenkii]